MKKRLTSAALVAFGLVACNGILGIDSPTLVTGTSTDAGDAKSNDAAGGHDASHDGGRDAALDGRQGNDATTEAGRDAGVDAPVVVDAAHDVEMPHDANVFDGHCSCEGDACAVVVVATTPGGVDSLVSMPAGVCFYAVNDTASPFPGSIQCVTFAGAHTVVDDSANQSSSVAANGNTLYWANLGLNEVRTCTLPSCVPTELATGSGGFLVGNIAAGPTSVYWDESNAIESCPIGSVCVDSGARVPSSGSFERLSVNDRGVYWSSSVGVSFCPTAGCDAATVVADAGNSITQIRATNANVYWSNNDLWSCPVSDAGACASPPTMLAATVEIAELAVDSTGAYWTSVNAQAINALAADGGDVRTVTSVAPMAGVKVPLTLGATCVYWAEDGDGGGVIKAVAKSAP